MPNMDGLRYKGGENMRIDYWYKDGRRAVYATVTFYPNDGVYRGNIYDVDGNMIGDFTSADSVEIERRFPGIFGE